MLTSSSFLYSIRTRGMLSVAFQASWNQLATDFQSQPMSQTRYVNPFSILKASVTKWRVLVWYALKLLLTFSGVIMGLVQSRCRFKTVRDPILATLLLDTSALTIHDEGGPCNAISSEAIDERRKLRLVISGESHPSYGHPYLEADNVEIIREREDGEYSCIYELEK